MQTGGGWRGRSTIGPGASAVPVGSCWTRPYSGPGSQRPWRGERSATKPPEGRTDGEDTGRLFWRFLSLLELREGAGQASVSYLSISVHHSMSSFSFMKTGKCWSLPCLMELDLVVMVLTLSNCKEGETVVPECVWAIKTPRWFCTDIFILTDGLFRSWSDKVLCWFHEGAQLSFYSFFAVEKEQWQDRCVHSLYIQKCIIRIRNGQRGAACSDFRRATDSEVKNLNREEPTSMWVNKKEDKSLRQHWLQPNAFCLIGPFMPPLGAAWVQSLFSFIEQPKGSWYGF